MPQIIIFSGFLVAFFAVWQGLTAQLQRVTAAHLYFCIGTGFYGCLLGFSLLHFLYCTALWAFVLLLCVLFFLIYKYKKQLSFRSFELPLPSLEEYTFIGFWGLFALPAIAFFSHKNHYWDAFGIWNLHARYLLQSAQFERLFLLPNSLGFHADYPFFLPSAVALFWRAYGSEAEWISYALGVLSSLMLGFLVFGACRSLAPSPVARLPLAALHSVSLYCIVFLLHVFASGCADVPLALAVVITVTLSLFAERQQNPLLWQLAFFAAASSSFIKNEGLFFSIFYFATAMYGRASRAEWRSALAAILLFALPFWVTKSYHPPANDVLELAGAWREKVTNVGRYWFIIKKIAFILSTTFPYFLLLGAISLYRIFKSRSESKSETQKTTQLPSRYWLVLLLCLVAYCGVYLITPYALAWHIESSFARLFLHLLPATLVLLWLQFNDE